MMTMMMVPCLDCCESHGRFSPEQIHRAVENSPSSNPCIRVLTRIGSVAVQGGGAGALSLDLEPTWRCQCAKRVGQSA